MAKKEDKVTFKERLAAFSNLPAFFKMIWQTSPSMTLANMGLRLVKAGLPVAMLWVGKLIIDEIILQSQLTEAANYDKIWLYLGAELVLALLSDLINRAITLFDSLLGDLFSNRTSEELIRQAARLDLAQLEDARFYDKLSRARRQTIGRTVLMSQVLSQAQDTITILFFSAALVAFNPILIVILIVAVIPAFLGENYFNAAGYSLSRSWTPERRELDYLRLIGASDETAKEVRVFGLQQFISQRFSTLAHKYFLVNKRLSVSRASWAGC